MVKINDTIEIINIKDEYLKQYFGPKIGTKWVVVSSDEFGIFCWPKPKNLLEKIINLIKNPEVNIYLQPNLENIAYKIIND